MSYVVNKGISGINNNHIDVNDSYSYVLIPTNDLLYTYNGNTVARMTPKGHAFENEQSGLFLHYGSNNYALFRASDLISNRKNLGIGLQSLDSIYALSAYSNNIAIGFQTGMNLQGNNNIFIGNDTGSLMSSHSASLLFGHNIASGITVCTNSIVFGSNTILNDTTIQNKFIVDFYDRGVNGAQKSALIYADFNQQVSAQTFRINAGNSILYGKDSNPTFRIQNNNTGQTNNDGSYLTINNDKTFIIGQNEIGNAIVFNINNTSALTLTETTATYLVPISGTSIRTDNMIANSGLSATSILAGSILSTSNQFTNITATNFTGSNIVGTTQISATTSIADNIKANISISASSVSAVNINALNVNSTNVTASSITGSNILASTGLSATSFVGSSIIGVNTYSTNLTSTNSVISNLNIPILVSATSVSATNIIGTSVTAISLNATNTIINSLTANNLSTPSVSSTNITATNLAVTNMTGTPTVTGTLISTNVSANNVSASSFYSSLFSPSQLIVTDSAKRMTSYNIGNLSGTSNQVTVTNGTGSMVGNNVTLSLPQNIDINATVSFSNINISNNGNITTVKSNLVSASSVSSSSLTAASILASSIVGVNTYSTNLTANTIVGTSLISAVNTSAMNTTASNSTITNLTASNIKVSSLTGSKLVVTDNNSNLASYNIGNLNGTASQINVTNGGGTMIGNNVTLSLPQNIDTNSNVNFSIINLSTSAQSPIISSTNTTTINLTASNIKVSSLTGSKLVVTDNNSNLASYNIGNLNGTASQINVTNGGGTMIGNNVTLSLPQNIDTNSNVVFSSISATNSISASNTIASETSATVLKLGDQLYAPNIHNNYKSNASIHSGTYIPTFYTHNVPGNSSYITCNITQWTKIGKIYTITGLLSIFPGFSLDDIDLSIPVLVTFDNTNGFYQAVGVYTTHSDNTYTKSSGIIRGIINNGYVNARLVKVPPVPGGDTNILIGFTFSVTESF